LKRKLPQICQRQKCANHRGEITDHGIVIHPDACNIPTVTRNGTVTTRSTARISSCVFSDGPGGSTRNVVEFLPRSALLPRQQRRVFARARCWRWCGRHDGIRVLGGGGGDGSESEPISPREPRFFLMAFIKPQHGRVMFVIGVISPFCWAFTSNISLS
jgi:hypothetical protein